MHLLKNLIGRDPCKGCPRRPYLCAGYEKQWPWVNVKCSRREGWVP